MWIYLKLASFKPSFTILAEENVESLHPGLLFSEIKVNISLFHILGFFLGLNPSKNQYSTFFGISLIFMLAFPIKIFKLTFSVIFSFKFFLEF